MWALVAVVLRLSGDNMAISLPGTTRFGLRGLRGRKQKKGKATDNKAVKREDIARLFQQDFKEAKTFRPAKLNESEKQDSARISGLRGALYSKD